MAWAQRTPLRALLARRPWARHLDAVSPRPTTPPMFHQSGLYRMTIGAYYGWWTGEPRYLAAM